MTSEKVWDSRRKVSPFEVPQGQAWSSISCRHRDYSTVVAPQPKDMQGQIQQPSRCSLKTARKLTIAMVLQRASGFLQNLLVAHKTITTVQSLGT
jgi:hypothetical protein